MRFFSLILTLLAMVFAASAGFAGECPDQLSFDNVVGTPSSKKGSFSPAVAYTVSVDTNCKASVQLDYSIE